MRTTVHALPVAIAALLIALNGAARPGAVQSQPDPEQFFRQDLGLSPDEIAAVRSGQPVAKILPSRTPAEVFLVGAVYIHATPDSYVQYARDLDRLRALPTSLAVGAFSTPPRLSDLKGFAFDSDEIQALRDCTPGDCSIQMPTSSIEELHRSIDWSSADLDEQVNRLLQTSVLQLLLAYQRRGNQALGVYNDKDKAADVSRQFGYMLSDTKALPAYLPAFYHYLLMYPAAKPANVEDTFYWARVTFGLKPTLRVVHVVTMRGSATEPVAWAIAEKQLYSSHYFETALDLSFCVRGGADPAQPGFYLITAMGSEQAGLTGFKGSIVRKVAVGRSVSNLRDGLMTIRQALEAGR
jgi:hypothetical protein